MATVGIGMSMSTFALPGNDASWWISGFEGTQVYAIVAFVISLSDTSTGSSDSTKTVMTEDCSTDIPFLRRTKYTNGVIATPIAKPIHEDISASDPTDIPILDANVVSVVPSGIPNM